MVAILIFLGILVFCYVMLMLLGNETTEDMAFKKLRLWRRRGKNTRKKN